MCGRYSLIQDMGQLALRFDFDASELTHAPAYNIAPTQQVLTVRETGGGREATFMRWGLIPSWAKDQSIGARMINARAESAAERPAFRTALRRRRCLVLADGFYEWQPAPGRKAKRPMRITLRSGEPFAFAGLWDTWTSPQGTSVESCAVLTIAANKLLAPIHDRMPAILNADVESLWLAPTLEDSAALIDLLRPYDPADMETYEVSTLVNSVANNKPGVLSPAVMPEAEEGQQRLDWL